MTSREFCYWLQGYFEIQSSEPYRAVLTADQIEMVKKHLSMVFVHEIDPSYPEQDKLNKIHNQGKEPEAPPRPPYESDGEVMVRC